MKGSSHLLIGLAATYALHRLALPLAVAPLDWLPIGAAAAVGAFLPDIDSDESAIRQGTGTARSQGCWGKFVSLVVHTLTGGHRNLTHTLAACGVLSITAIVLSLLVVHYAAPGIAFGVAYLSHLIADALTVQGVPLAWPVSHKNINLLPRPLRVRTGSWAEYALMVAMGVGIFNLWSGV